MLETLNQIPWKKLTHAYGKAGDTPRHLRSLASGLKWKRARALDALWFSIIHQGSVYEAAAYAVPFLVELASNPQVADRDEILSLLQDIACGSGWHQNHQRLEIVRRVFSDEKISQGIERETEWVRQIKRAISDSAASIIELLNDGDAKVRMAAASFLTVVGSAADQSVARMKGALAKESSSQPRANLLMAISNLAAPKEAALFRAEFARAPDALTRMVAAMGIIASDVENPSSEALLALFEILRNRDVTLR